MSGAAPVLTAGFWRTRRAAAVAGILFGVLLLAAMTMMRLRSADAGLESLQSDEHRRMMIRLSLHLVPFAGIAFLWFIGVVREQLGDVEDRLFSTVFLGSGLLFLAMLFSGAVTSSSIVAMLDGPSTNPDVWAYGRDNAQRLISVYAMRMAAVFTLSVSTAGLRASALPRWISYVGYAVALGLLLGSAEQKWLQLLFPAVGLAGQRRHLVHDPPAFDGWTPPLPTPDPKRVPVGGGGRDRRAGVVVMIGCRPLGRGPRRGRLATNRAKAVRPATFTRPVANATPMMFPATVWKPWAKVP